jgi:hypothetical protein
MPASVPVVTIIVSAPVPIPFTTVLTTVFITTVFSTTVFASTMFSASTTMLTPTVGSSSYISSPSNFSDCAVDGCDSRVNRNGEGGGAEILLIELDEETNECSYLSPRRVTMTSLRGLYMINEFS